MPTGDVPTANTVGRAAWVGATPGGGRGGVPAEMGLAGSAEGVEPLIVTKLVPPRLQERLVRRPRVLDLLNRGAAGPVTIVSGGAGAGKTVAVASWVESGRPPGPVAWVSLDGDDNDPVRFWSQVLAALRSSGAVLTDNLLADLVPLPLPSESFYVRLASGLAQLRAPVVLVLDDVHQITDRSVLPRLAALLRHPAPMLRLVLVTRVDPQLPLPRLRLEGQLTEIRSADLAFTAAEAEALFTQSSLVLTRTQINRLLERTEGWAAGLRLAALSLQSKATTGQGHAEASDLVDQFVGEEKTVVDYLLDEVLAGLPDADRDFLLQTSVVEQVCADLAQVLTGRRDGQRLLETLEQSNAFVVGVGTHRVWFRYHQLFREVLRHELQLQAPALVPVAHRAAAVWWHGHDEPIQSLRHAIEARDWAFAEVLALHALLPHILGPDRETLCALLSQLPEDQLQTRAGLSLARALRDFHLRDVDGMSGRAASAARLAAGKADADRAPILVFVRLIEVAAARLHGDTPAVIAAATQAETLLAGIPAGVVPAAAYQNIITNNRGTALLWTGNLVEAERDLIAGLKGVPVAQMNLPHLNALGYLALIAVGRGKLRLSDEHGRAAADIAEQRGWTAEMQMATAYLALALCHFEWGNLDEAYVYLDQATNAHRADQEPPVAVALQIARARFHLAAGEATAARTALAAARARYGDRPLPAFLHRLVAVEEADLDLATGHPQRVQDRFTRLGVPDIDVWSTDRERVRLALAQLALGQPQQVATTVGSLLADEPGNPGPVLEAWLVTALAADRLREDARALDALSAALHLAAPENRQRPFLTADPRLCELLARHAELVSSQHDFIKQILANLAHQQASARPAPLGEPLTDRETAVLRYLPTLLTNTELAEQMYISVNTVKAHLKSLYRKLDVTSRRQAVHRARELGLL